MVRASKDVALEEPQTSPRKIRPMPSRRSLRAGAKRQEQEKQEKENDEVEELETEEEDLGSLKTRRTPRKPASRRAKNGTAPKNGGKSRAKPLAKAPDEDEEMADVPEAEDVEEGDLGVMGRGGSGKRIQKEYDSDALDDDEETPTKKRSSTKRKRATTSESPKKSSPGKKRRRTVKEDDSDEDDDLELKEGQEVVGKVVQAPKTGRVPAGQISQNTMNFLSKLANPACNDREWFKLHEPVYRLAEKEWKDFVEKFTELLIEVDDQIPPLPPRDVIHRIYRDIRFSNDKTPYKRSFSASFSRSGRKGIFAHYHITNLMRNSQPLRDIITSPDFVKYFGEAKAQPNGQRSNIFGAEDELKVAPKGVDKEHEHVPLSRLERSV
ncbi:hypothetical protein V5O48_009895 [Marasmius crinis-equi]|uniref:Uncharacterized protein n=1 Tax=Marasmius crinis-equi TaxID=585013 RepID=A0ABR3FAD5_9AGAR